MECVVQSMVELMNYRSIKKFLACVTTSTQHKPPHVAHKRMITHLDCTTPFLQHAAPCMQGHTVGIGVTPFSLRSSP